jgi:ketosteroid isomerase-like protein
LGAHLWRICRHRQPLVRNRRHHQGVRDFTSQVEGLRFGEPTIYRVEGDDAIFAEFNADATVIATGRPYHQDYVFYLRARGGKVVLIREYFDAVRLVAAFRETSDNPHER